MIHLMQPLSHNEIYSIGWNIRSVYLWLILCFFQCFCQVLIGAFCLCELLCQWLVDRFHATHLTLLLGKSREHTKNKKDKLDLYQQLFLATKLLSTTAHHCQFKWFAELGLLKGWTTFTLTGVYSSSNSSERSYRDFHSTVLGLRLWQGLRWPALNLFRTGMRLPAGAETCCLHMKRRSWIRSDTTEGWLEDLRSSALAWICPPGSLVAPCLTLASLSFCLAGGSGRVSEAKSLLRECMDVERPLNPGLGMVPLCWTRSRYMLCECWRVPRRPKLFMEPSSPAADPSLLLLRLERAGNAPLLTSLSRLTHLLMRFSNWQLPVSLNNCLSEAIWHTASSSRLPATDNLRGGLERTVSS